MSTSVPNRAPNVLTATGTITVLGSGLYHVNQTFELWLTLAAPTTDGIELTFIDETGNGFVIQVGGCPATGLNVNQGTLTCPSSAGGGNGCTVVSRNGRWYSTWRQGVTLS